MASNKAKPVWKKAAPAKSTHRKLSSAQKTKAKASAKRAGRPYPNLVDNMHAAQNEKASVKRPARKKKTARAAV